MVTRTVALGANASSTGLRIEIEGLVQGVGFRPWVHRLATDLGVRGRVWNDGHGVTVEAHGDRPRLTELVRRLSSEAPATATVQRLSVHSVPPSSMPAFRIERTRGLQAATLCIGPDQATCPDCVRELLDPGNRRHGYAFTNCTACGPRFTIVTAAPYDRERTTMAGFSMCARCQHEHEDVEDRRFHAQPNACPECGPALRMDGAADPLLAAAEALRNGEIVAIKGLGGFHLACDATDDDAVARLRRLKGRDTKPFAVMVADLCGAQALARVDAVARASLGSAAAPIVLLPSRSATLSKHVAPDDPWLGLMLPYTPLHHRLLRAVERPLVMTSGNRSDEPIEIDDDEARRRLAPLADRFLLHDRPIARRADDSLVRVIAGAPTVLRRARGFVPRSIRLARPVAEPILACGAQLKNTVCIAVGDRAYLSAHHGDLDQLRAADAFEAGVEQLQSLLGAQPRVVASDLHPDFVSTRYARRRGGARWIGVQHHHAHIASAMAEHCLQGEVYGLAFDGVGYGLDGRAWGGELLLASAEGFTRLVTFRPVRLPGGDVAVTEIWRTALALVWDAFEGQVPPGLELLERVPAGRRALVEQMLEQDLRCPPTHAVGRYFDAVAALGLACPTAGHEGQAAMRWEQAAAAAGSTRPDPYELVLDRRSRPWQLDLRPGIRQLVAELLAGRDRAAIAARYHDTIVAASLTAVNESAKQRGPRPIVLSGGCFQNARLCEGLLAAAGPAQAIFMQRDVPPNDGGIALGQVLVASELLERGRLPCV
ncbi:MAG: carbamoyltransferase HypF [Nannocystaceae bacterium]